jgi:O-antigen/teichoic acid export membrane protein
VLVWYVLASRYLALDFSKVSIRTDLDPAFIWRTLTKYSLWVHLTGVATNFIYRADAFFLSFFAPLSVVGNYNVALTGANVANVAPSILGYQNSVAISHSTDQAEGFRLTDVFLRVSIYIGLATLCAFAILGGVYLQWVTGQPVVDDIYAYMMCIVIGLVIVKTMASPFVAYINVKADVRRLFLRVNLPALLFSAGSYYFAARYFGAMGLAVSNIVNAVAWTMLLSMEMRRLGYRLPAPASFASDVRWLRARVLGRMRPHVAARTQE